MIDAVAKPSCPGWGEAEQYLSDVDPKMATIIRAVGACTLSPRPDYFTALCQSIISQQISTKAAQSVFAKFKELFSRKRVTPAHAIGLDETRLRSAGLSGQKAKYIRSMAEAFVSGAVPTRQLKWMDDEDVIEALIPIKGVGRWTAEMFLMFVLNRPDVLPAGDLGIRMAARNVYELTDLPEVEELTRLAEPWRPWRTVACWYLWRSAPSFPVPVTGLGEPAAPVAKPVIEIKKAVKPIKMKKRSVTVGVKTRKSPPRKPTPR